MSVSTLARPVRRSFFGIILSLLVALAIVPLAGAQSGNAMVRVAHASPDAPAVDVYVNDNRVLSNVPFGAVSDYLSVPPSTLAVKVLPAGAPAGDQGVIEADVTVAAGQAYTIAATGRLADIAPAVLNDNLSAPASGKAKVRLVHTGVDAPAVDVAVAGGPVLLSNVSFGNSSAYVEVDAGAYDLEVRPAGQSAVALAVPGVTVQAGTTYSIFALGVLSGQPALMAEPVVDARAAAGMPGTGAGGMAETMNQSLSLALIALGLSGLVAVVALRRRAASA